MPALQNDQTMLVDHTHHQPQEYQRSSKCEIERHGIPHLCEPQQHNATQDRRHFHDAEGIAVRVYRAYTGSKESINQLPSIFVSPTFTLLAANAPSGFSWLVVV